MLALVRWIASEHKVSDRNVHCSDLGSRSTKNNVVVDRDEFIDQKSRRIVPGIRGDRIVELNDSCSSLNMRLRPVPRGRPTLIEPIGDRLRKEKPQIARNEVRRCRKRRSGEVFGEFWVTAEPFTPKPRYGMLLHLSISDTLGLS